MVRHEGSCQDLHLFGLAEAGLYLEGQAGQFPEQVRAGCYGLVRVIVGVEVGRSLFHQVVDGVAEDSELPDALGQGPAFGC